MISFMNDYSEGAHPRIMEALNRTNLEQTVGYGMDEYCAEAADLIRKRIGRPDAAVHFMVGGTPTNVTVIAAALRPYQGAIAASTGHIAVHESGAVEGTGHKVLTIPTENGKINAEQIERLIRAHFDSETHEHEVQPGIVYISQPTELGTLYSKSELSDISRVCRKFHIPLYIDGARLAAALASEQNDLSIEDLAQLTDVFYIGGTKMGCLIGEALIINNPRIDDDFRYMIKRQCGLLAKGRLLGIQFAELFRDGLYEEIGRDTMSQAVRLREGLKDLGCKFLVDSPTNQIFPIFSDELIAELREKYRFELWSRVDMTHTAVRFVTSWATKPENVDALLHDVNALMK